MSASAVVFNLCGCRLTWIRKDFVGCTPLVIFIAVFGAGTSRRLCTARWQASQLNITNIVALSLITKDVLNILLIQIALTLLFSCEDHLICLDWWTYALLTIG